MTKRDFFSISLKILGVVYIIFAVFNLASLFTLIEVLFYPSGRDPSTLIYAGMAVAFFIFVLILVYILFKWGNRIAQKLVKDDTPLPALGTRDWEKPLFTLSLRVAGVFCLIGGVPGLIYHLYQWIADIWGSWFGPTTGNLIWPDFLKDIVLVALGLYLLRGGKHVVRYVFQGPKDKPIENASK